MRPFHALQAQQEADKASKKMDNLAAALDSVVDTVYNERRMAREDATSAVREVRRRLLVNTNRPVDARIGSAMSAWKCYAAKACALHSLDAASTNA